MASTSTANDAVTCEIKIDPVAIARAVSHATKHIAREPEDAYEFPSGERDGERGREGRDDDGEARARAGARTRARTRDDGRWAREAGAGRERARDGRRAGWGRWTRDEGAIARRRAGRRGR